MYRIQWTGSTLTLDETLGGWAAETIYHGGEGGHGEAENARHHGLTASPWITVRITTQTEFQRRHSRGSQQAHNR